MKFEEYIAYFESILADPSQYQAYQDEEYLNFTKLNWSRMNRWLKKFEPTTEASSFINRIQTKQHWILITEPWCGDAAHSVPVIYQMVKNNPNIELDIQLRDAEPFLIDQYLTNGGKSIPKLIIRDEQGQDIAVWGPRPQGCADLFLKMKEQGAEFNEIKEEIQKWYNQDKGVAIQQELVQILS
ncbi:thioredoxin family protein [Sphingobacterium sp. SRCM116780]|uniref:thioredoxin family protein n=1 Tax=Sphingobacterium sp. SRCM116780 TaxID=2907623 RepID=UPI001F41A562|nr:thioredoxin family protein [Sphingobacterium sp. SRCM116780]UIR56146.1 thioredoxin family protein [Sphingobacterium sp. SRCM116780]